ncbi:hypothetical protein [Kineococcus radiotolerans]|uniref:Uncharacterized protein n=1 Tax=Kineococcus radiotolerans (strain ATCC BAA-149 / DSM 14245 / SRS30216) TaxID=266940 RepID=A6W8R3_KINRD|nr:hypothetical protein [Kineococcus radiotolerans]ABS03202.1 hypothetical protein Krad_1716 [Kineococcus radiotolerans SRS30216 = ATCC BAA-149]
MVRLGNYEPDEAAWDRIVVSQSVLDACMAEATRGMAYAESISPQRTGDYRSHFKVEASTVTLPAYGVRAAAELSNDSDHAVPLEFGTQPSISAGSYRPGMRAQRILGETAAFLGGSP